MREVHVMVPASIGDPRRVSGGDVYDRRLLDALAGHGWRAHEVPVDVGDASTLARELARVPDDGLALVDGLIASRAPAEVERAAARLRIVLLAHMVSAALPSEGPAARDGERRAARAAHRVIATSPWTKAELARRGLADASRVDVAVPGSDAAAPAEGTTTGRALLTVGVVAPHKGQDLLVDALRELGGLEGWTCTIAGSLDADPAFVADVEASVADGALEGRIRLAGVLTGAALDDAYRTADLVVAPSRAESYGMAVADALGRGIPVLAADAGGLRHTVAPSGAGMLVPANDGVALADALRRWMTDPALRTRLRVRALAARGRLPRWSETAARVAAALERVS